MHCPTLSELPPPPPGKTGWPWMEESPQLPDRLPDGSPWPRVSIVTPSYNQGQFIEETIRSVLLQGYPDLEYIIIDGGSTDNSVEIIRKYEPWLAYWVSEPDRGQSHAINKGWQRSTGEILAWLNSDDLYTVGAISTAVGALQANPQAGMVYSDGVVIDSAGKHLRDLVSQPFDVVTLLTRSNYIPQPTVFIRRSVLDAVGWLDERLHMAMDLDLWLRIGLQLQLPVVYLPEVCLAKYRVHSTSKSIAHYEQFPLESLLMWDRVFNARELPRRVTAVRALAYSQLYFVHAIHMVQRGQETAAIRYLLKALYTHPKYVAGRPLVALAVLKQAALGLFFKVSKLKRGRAR